MAKDDAKETVSKEEEDAGNRISRPRSPPPADSSGRKRQREEHEHRDKRAIQGASSRSHVSSSEKLASSSHPTTTAAAAASAEKEVNSSNISTSTATNNSNNNCTTVYIGNLPNQYCTESVVEKIMSKYGSIQRCNIVRNFSFCEFETPGAAAAAIQAVNGRRLGGNRLAVRFAHRQQQQQQTDPNSSTTTMNNNSTYSKNPKRQKQQIESKIQLIKRQLAAKQADRR